MGIFYVFVLTSLIGSSAYTMNLNRDQIRNASVVELTCSTENSKSFVTFVEADQENKSPIRRTAPIRSEVCAGLMAESFHNLRCNFVIVDLVTADNGVDAGFGIIAVENLRRNNKACL